MIAIGVEVGARAVAVVSKVRTARLDALSLRAARILADFAALTAVVWVGFEIDAFPRAVRQAGGALAKGPLAALVRRFTSILAGLSTYAIETQGLCEAGDIAVPTMVLVCIETSAYITAESLEVGAFGIDICFGCRPCLGELGCFRRTIARGIVLDGASGGDADQYEPSCAIERRSSHL